MITPQQADFIAYYFDPTSETYCDAKNSALKAEYSLQYAENITGQLPKWLSDALGQKKRLIEKAKQKLEVFLDSEDEKIAQDTTKFVLKTIGKDEGFSERTEHTGKGGGPIELTKILDELSN